MHFKLTTLPNGLRVLTEQMPELRSVAIGCWVDTGTRDEAPSEAGASHFLEHLLFKGSQDYSANDISAAFDAVGAHSNAFTTKELTAFWARLRDTDLVLGFELLSEMITKPAFRDDEIDSERHVVFEEINMNEDDPGDVAHEEFSTALWSGHPLEAPILGTRDSILAMDRATISGYWGRRYSPWSIAIAVAGNLDHDNVVDVVTRFFGSWEGDPISHDLGHPRVDSGLRVVRRDTEQAHLVFGGSGLRQEDDRRFAFGLLDHILGGGMSSRLFREIREERGLAYAVQSFRMPYRDTGAWGVYAGTTPHQAHEVLGLLRIELDKLVQHGVSSEELTRAKGFAAGSLALATEDANSRMARLGRAEISGAEHLDLDEAVARFEAVTRQEVLEVAQAVFEGPRVLGAVGPFAEDDLAEFVA